MKIFIVCFYCMVEVNDIVCSNAE